MSTVTDNHNSSVSVLVGHNPVSVISAEPVQPVREQAKRKRGRPRKETASQPPPVKKPRGRPRKDYFIIVTNFYFVNKSLAK